MVWLLGLAVPGQQRCPRTSTCWGSVSQCPGTPGWGITGTTALAFLKAGVFQNPLLWAEHRVWQSCVLQGTTSGGQKEAAMRMGGCLVKWSRLQAGLRPLFSLLCQQVKLRKIFSGKSKARFSAKERNSCWIPGTANVNGAPLVFIQLEGWFSLPSSWRTPISLIPPV